jgi:OPA family sugar phosphate sensor protein UhpC-like MFS transporter
MQLVGDDRVYHFGPAIMFWIGASVVSMLLALCLWRTRRMD